MSKKLDSLEKVFGFYHKEIFSIKKGSNLLNNVKSK